MNIRGFAKRSKAGKLIWRIFIGVLGGTVTVLGAIALVAPGPGVLILLAGLGILATEFAWASRAMNNCGFLRLRFHRVEVYRLDKSGAHPHRMRP